MKSRNKQKAGSKKNQPFFVGEKLEVSIEKLSFSGGRGIAREKGFVLFVENAIPGEKLLIEVTKLQKNFAEAKAVDFIEASPQRVEPPCEYFHKCNGCNWQHIPYEQQLHYKSQILQEFVDKSKLASKPQTAQFFSSEKALHYRNRIQLHKKGDLVGYHKKKSHKIVPIDKCLIADEKINDLLPELKSKNDGRYEIKLLENGHAKVFDSGESPISFSQVNNSQNEQMTSILLEELTKVSPRQILELYCGNGNLSFPVFEKTKPESMTAVELNEESIKLAKQQNSFQKLNFECDSCEDFINKTPLSDAETLLLDPPRTGLSPEVTEFIGNNSFKNVFYISCNPSTLIRDLERLETFSFQLEKIYGFDMFPQTDHIESLSIITKA